MGEIYLFLCLIIDIFFIFNFDVLKGMNGRKANKCISAPSFVKAIWVNTAYHLAN